MLLLLPGYCLINSKMIVCNVTHMETESHSWTFTVFLLFPLNFAYGVLVPEWQIALAIGALTFASYATFVVCTIGQITKLLDINCLSLKAKVDEK